MTDATMTWITCSLPEEERLAYLPAYFEILLTAAAINHASIEEIGDWKSCGVMIPPGEKLNGGGAKMMLKVGFQNMLWRLRWGGYGVFIPSFVFLVINSTSLARNIDYMKANERCNARDKGV